MISIFIKELAKQAGFCFWSNEPHAGDRRGQIDWSSEYDNELEEFAKLLIHRCASECNDWKTPTEIKRDIQCLIQQPDFDGNMQELKELIDNLSARLQEIEKLHGRPKT